MFYIVSPKDLVLAKVCFERFTNVVSFHFGYGGVASLPSSVTVASSPIITILLSGYNNFRYANTSETPC